MHRYIPRELTAKIKKRLAISPIVAILGSRQCGKSTLAHHLLNKTDIYIDLENPDDYQKLQRPTAFLEENQTKLICLDEIQRYPHFFEILRSHVDKQNRPRQLLILGSASRDLIQQSSESLAGRISYTTLAPLLPSEVSITQLNTLWLRGGYPRSFLAKTDEDSMIWRTDFIQTYLERDIPQLGLNISPSQMRRLWMMLAHLHGQTLNKAKLAGSLGVDNHTVQRYIDILKDTFMITVLEPYHTNLKKRLIKAPKIYLSDPGMVHALLKIGSFNDLLGHPIYGMSWEGFVVQSIIHSADQWTPSFYRTSNGTEIDLILEKNQEKIAIEIKASSAPKITPSFFNTLDELKITESYVIAPVKTSYPLTKTSRVCPLSDIVKRVQ